MVKFRCEMRHACGKRGRPKVLLGLAGLLALWTIAGGPFLSHRAGRPHGAAWHGATDGVAGRQGRGGSSSSLRGRQSFEPQRCVGWGCYIVDSTVDPYHPRVLVVLLGLPESEVHKASPHHLNMTNMTFEDYRSGKNVTLTSLALRKKTGMWDPYNNSFFVRLSSPSSPGAVLEAPCRRVTPTGQSNPVSQDSQRPPPWGSSRRWS
jgi:hypothetical protein